LLRKSQESILEQTSSRVTLAGTVVEVNNKKKTITENQHTFNQSNRENK
jgi:hypothetical protein